MRVYVFLCLIGAVTAAGVSSCDKAASRPHSTSMPAPKPTLYYVFDPLCGWCYGFSPTMQAVAAHYAGRLDIEVISGGMVTGQRVGPIGQVAGFIKTAYKDVENATGTKFGPGFLNGTLAKGTATFSSLEPSLALAAVRSHNPKSALAFAHDLQHAIYYDGAEPTDFNALAPYAEKYGLAKADFLRTVKLPLIHQQVLKEFRTSDSLKVTGFPTLFIMKNQKLLRVSEGFLPKKELESRIDAVLAQK